MGSEFQVDSFLLQASRGEGASNEVASFWLGFQSEISLRDRRSEKITQPHMSIELVTRVGLKLLMADIFKNFESLNLLLTIDVLENKAAFFFSFFKKKNKVLKN